MNTQDEHKLKQLVKAYVSVGALLEEELQKHIATISKSMKNELFILKSHTALMNHEVNRAYQNIAKDVPVSDTSDAIDGFRMKLACGVTLGLGNCRTREEAVEQVESGQHDEMIGQLLAQFCGEGKQRKVLEIEPLG
jgi:hypothetical protein